MANFPVPGIKNSQLNPFRAMTRMQRQVDRMFDDLLSGGWVSEVPVMTETVFQPLCDIQEGDTHFLLSFDLPGISKNDVKIDLQDNVLRVYGERKDERERGKGAHARIERTYGAFERVMALPSNVKVEGIEAQFENGVLNIAIPKAEAAKSKPIQISEGKPGILSKLLGKKEEKAA